MEWNLAKYSPEDIGANVEFVRKAPPHTKRKPQERESELSPLARAEAEQKAIEERKQQAENNIRTRLRGFPPLATAPEEDKYYGQYVSWVKNSLKGGLALNPEEDLVLSNPNSGEQGKKKGRKRRNLTQCLYKTTNIQVTFQSEPYQDMNLATAVRRIVEPLEEHLSDWRAYVSGKPGARLSAEQMESITPDLIINMLLEPEDKSSK